MTTILRFATRTPRIPETVDTLFSPLQRQSKSDDSSAFGDHDPPIPETVDTFEMTQRESKSDDSSAFCDHDPALTMVTIAWW